MREMLPSMEGHEPNCPCSVGRAHSALDAIASELRQALARAEAAEAFIRKMDMSYRYEEFRAALAEIEESG